MEFLSFTKTWGVPSQPRGGKPGSLEKSEGPSHQGSVCLWENCVDRVGGSAFTRGQCVVEMVSQKSRGLCSALAYFRPLSHALCSGVFPSLLQLCTGGHLPSWELIHMPPPPRSFIWLDNSELPTLPLRSMCKDVGSSATGYNSLRSRSVIPFLLLLHAGASSTLLSAWCTIVTDAHSIKDIVLINF